jgi:1-acyl-sn-glycerol-3-phosphate acyltransferase
MKDKKIIYNLVKGICYPFFMFLYHPKIIGKEKLNIKEGYILVGNHTAYLDVFLLIAANKRKIHFFTKIELFNTKIKNSFFTSMGCIPVDRKKKNNGSILEGVKVLNEEKVVGIFPEGTYNRTDKIIMPFKYGAVAMAQKTNKALIPFAIVGRYQIFGKRVKIIFGEPYKLKEDLETENHKLEQKVISLIKENQ